MTDYPISTDFSRLFDEQRSALGGPGTRLRKVPSTTMSANRPTGGPPDLAILDMQTGTMGGIGVYFDIGPEIDADRVAPFPILLPLDRRAGVFMARRGPG